jgi:hypothetical protein
VDSVRLVEWILRTDDHVFETAHDDHRVVWEARIVWEAAHRVLFLTCV